MEIYHISNTTGSANAIPLGSYKRLVYHCLPSGWWVHIGECLPRVHHKCSEHVVCAIPEIVKVELFAGTSLQKGFLQVSENKAAVPAWTAAKSLDRSVSSSEFRFLCVLVPPAVIKSAEDTASEHYHCCLDSLYLLEILRIQSLVCNLCSNLPPFWKKNRAIIYYIWK